VERPRTSHSATPPWFEHVPEWCAEYDVVPSLHRAVGVPLFVSRVELRGEAVDPRPWAVSLRRPKRPSRIPPDLLVVFESASSPERSARALPFADFSSASAEAPVSATPPWCEHAPRPAFDVLPSCR
jgi:hypothetical protein